MKIETAIENLKSKIDEHEKYEAFLVGEDSSEDDGSLHAVELELEALRMAVRALEGRKNNETAL